jgi:hypothetical protein
MAGKIIADIIEAPYDAIRMNVANVTVLTANSSGLTYIPTGNVNVNIGTTANLTLGNVTVTNVIVANNGIRFPGTQNASTDGNTLDDYEEGTWTPFLQFGGTPSSGAVYSNQNGIYTKIGNMVYVQGYLNWTNKGSTTGIWQIGGLPFSTPSVGSTGGNANRAAVGAIGNSYDTQQGTTLYSESSSTYFLPTRMDASGRMGEMNQSSVASSAQIFFGGYYRVA